MNEGFNYFKLEMNNLESKLKTARELLMDAECVLLAHIDYMCGERDGGVTFERAATLQNKIRAFLGEK